MAKEKKSVYDRNFAEDTAIRERVAEFLLPRIKETRYQRYAMDQNLMRFFNMWNVTKDQFHSYQGRATLYIPEVRKNVEEQARQLTEVAFPSEDFFGVSPSPTGTKRGAEAWKSLHTTFMNNAAIRSKYFVAMRQMCMLGTAPIYLPWKKLETLQWRSAFNPKTKKIENRRHKFEIYNGPDFIVRDLFKWFALNPMKPDFQEDGCFEISVKSTVELLREAKAGLLASWEEIEKGPTNAYLLEELQFDVLRMEQMGLVIQNNVAYSGEAMLRDENPNPDATHEEITLHLPMICPEACEEDEDPELPIPMQIKIYDMTHPGLIRRNPFAHQQAPYVVGKYILPNADEFYGQGIPWSTQYMQYEMNSKAEQGMDSATLAINPIAVIDPGLAGGGQDFDVEPGAKWWANPQGVHFTSMPDLTEVAQRAISNLKAMMGDYSDRSPALPPQLMGKSRTATQSEIVSDSLSIDNKHFQIQNEIMILQPMLSQWEALADQNLDDDQIVMILGRRASDLRRTMLNKRTLLGRYQYFWKVSSSMQNRAILGRQMLDMIKVLTMLPPQLIQGLKIDWAEIIKVLWTDGFKLQDADRILGIPEEMASQDAEAENKMAALGLELEVLPGDDDDEHLSIHGKDIEKPKNEMQKLLLMQHVMEHNRQKQRKQQAMQQMQVMMQQQQQMAMLQAASGQGGQGGPRRSRGSGNRTQLSPNMTAGNQGSGVRS